MTDERKWSAEGIGPRQLKRINDLFSKINWEHKTYIQISRRFDGVNFHEDRTTYSDLFGGSKRADLIEQLNLLKESYQAKITPDNLKEIEEKLEDLLKWAQNTRPIKDDRKSEEELREQHQQHLDRMDEEQRKAEEFKARSVLIPIGKRGVILNVCFDNSDPMTDYFDRHHSIESLLLAIIPEGREDEKSLRNVIDRIPALNEIPFKWHTEKYSMGHGNYLESETCPEERPHPYDKDRQVRCHYEITFQKGYRNHENRAIPHPEYYLGEITGGGNGNGGREAVFEMTIRENPQMNGVEILFPSKPSRAVIDTLKGHGFRWSFKQGLWWKRNSPGLIENIEKALKGSSAAA